MTDRRPAAGILALICALFFGILALKGSLVSLAAESIAAKTGSSVEIGALRLSISGAEAREVEMLIPERGLRMRARRMALWISFLQLWRGRGLRLRRLELDGVELLAVLGSSSGVSGPRERRTPSPDRDSIRRLRAMLAPGAVVRLNGARFRLSSRDGTPLVSGRGWVSVSAAGGSLRVRGSGGIGENGGRMSFSGVLAPGRNSSGALRFDNVSLRPLLERMERVGWYRPDSARLDGRIELSKGEVLGLEGTLSLRRLGVRWSPIADRPVVAGASLSFRGRWDGTSLELERSRLQVREVEVEASGSFGWDPERSFGDLDLSLLEAECQDLLGAVPPSVLGELSGFALDGTIEGSLRLRFDTSDPEQTALKLDVRDRCRFLRAPEAADLRRLEGVFLHRAPGPHGRNYSFETGPGSEHWTPLSGVSLFLIHAVLAREDKTFFEHRGFAPFAVELALERNLEERRFASGASTISMQLAKNLFLARDKTLARKLKEALLTWWLEKSLPKEEILALYLNVVEFGPGVYGIGPAARHYFGRSASDLSPAESTFLAISLPSPSAHHRHYLRGELSSSMKTRMERLLRAMFDQGRIDAEALSFGLAELNGSSFFLREESSTRRRRRSTMGAAAPLPLLGPDRP